MTIDADPFDETIFDKAIRFQNQLISFSIGGGFEGGDSAYQELRRFFGARSDTKARLPDFVRCCRDLGQFWGWIKYERPTYAERRTLLWDAFHPLIDHLEADDRAPGVVPIIETLEAFDPEHVHTAWQKALDRRTADPEEAITAARALLETVCKHILDDARVPYPDDAEAMTARPNSQRLLPPRYLGDIDAGPFEVSCGELETPTTEIVHTWHPPTVCHAPAQPRQLGKP